MAQLQHQAKWAAQAALEASARIRELEAKLAAQVLGAASQLPSHHFRLRSQTLRVQLLRLTSHHAGLSLLCPLAAQAPRLWCLELPGLVLLQGRASFVCVSVCAPVSLSVCLPAYAMSCACRSSGALTALPTSLAGDVRRQDRVKRRSSVPSGTGRQLPQRRACLLPACRRTSMPACLPTPLPIH